MDSYLDFTGLPILITELQKISLLSGWINANIKPRNFCIPYFNSFCGICGSTFHNTFGELDLVRINQWHFPLLFLMFIIFDNSNLGIGGQLKKGSIWGATDKESYRRL